MYKLSILVIFCALLVNFCFCDKVTKPRGKFIPTDLDLNGTNKVLSNSCYEQYVTCGGTYGLSSGQVSQIIGFIETSSTVAGIWDGASEYIGGTWTAIVFSGGYTWYTNYNAYAVCACSSANVILVQQ